MVEGDRFGDPLKLSSAPIVAAYPSKLIGNYNAVNALGALRSWNPLRGLGSGIAESNQAPDGKAYAIYVVSAQLPYTLMNDVVPWTAVVAALLTVGLLTVWLRKRVINPVEP